MLEAWKGREATLSDPFFMFVSLEEPTFLSRLLTKAWIVLKLLGIHVLGIYIALEVAFKAVLPRVLLRREITGQTVLITGGASGLGRHVAMKLASRGARIVIWDVNTEGNNDTRNLIKKAKGECIAYTVDLRDRSAIYRTAALVKKHVGQVDILINNAGVLNGSHLLDTPDEQILRVFDVNVLSHFWTLKAFLPDMVRNNQGHLVTIASVVGLLPTSHIIDYAATKFAAVGLIDGLKLHLLDQGITGIHTTLVCPYIMDTPMTAGAKSKFLSIIKIDEAANEVVDAILMRKERLVIPALMKIFILLSNLMPLKFTSMCLQASDTKYTFETWLRHDRDNFSGHLDPRNSWTSTTSTRTS